MPSTCQADQSKQQDLTNSPEAVGRLLHRFGAVDLGEGNLTAGANVLAAMALAVAGLRRPGSSVVLTNGTTIGPRGACVVSGPLASELVAEKVFSPLRAKQTAVQYHNEHWRRHMTKEAQSPPKQAELCIPATADIPDFARQRAFPAVERHGTVYFFNAQQPAYPLPFFPGCDPDELAMAPAFTLTLDCPWYMIGANGIDVQHFLTTHDRELAAGPIVDHPQPHVHHSVCRFRVAGGGWRDRLTRLVAGPEVEAAPYEGRHMSPGDALTQLVRA